MSTVFPNLSEDPFDGTSDNKLHPNAVIQIASSVWKTGSRDIRGVLKIAKLCSPADTEGDIGYLLVKLVVGLK
jgi:hypothetical protein